MPFPSAVTGFGSHWIAVEMPSALVGPGKTLFWHELVIVSPADLLPWGQGKVPPAAVNSIIQTTLLCTLYAEAREGPSSFLLQRVL